MTPEDILHAEFPEQAMEYLKRSFDGLPHATHALWGLSYWLQDSGDQAGARMVADWAQEFAEHEANRANAAAARGGASRAPARRQVAPPSRRKPALDLSTCSLQEFGRAVNDAARSVTHGRWHSAVFISAVWEELLQQGAQGLTYDAFKRRLIQAMQDDLVELSRADLVEAMPYELVRDSETNYSGARFHFIRPM